MNQDVKESYRKESGPRRPGRPDNSMGPRASGPRGGPGGGPGRGKPDGKKGKKLLPQQVKAAKQMVEQSGIPFPAAVRVVLGKVTLNMGLGKATQTLFLSYVDSHCAFEGATLLKGGGDRAQLPSFVMKCKARMYNGRVTLFSTMLSGG